MQARLQRDAPEMSTIHPKLKKTHKTVTLFKFNPICESVPFVENLNSWKPSPVQQDPTVWDVWRTIKKIIARDNVAFYGNTGIWNESGFP